MAQNKEQLEKLLRFIKMLVDEPGNEDFVAKLQEMLNVIPLKMNVDNKKVDEIERYLGLDYHLDSSSPIIDYSFIEDEYIREQLISDCREMLRYRFGVRSHKIDFSEFCRYAMLQVEQLLNYFYTHCFSSTSEIIEYINLNVNWTKKEKIESVDSLSLAIKLSAFTSDKNRKQKDSLDFAREVRNSQSHRGKEAIFKDINDFKKQLLELGLPLTKDGEVVWTKIKDDEGLVKKYKSISNADYWKYRFQIWLKREPFDDVISALKDTAIQIKEYLGK